MTECERLIANGFITEDFLKEEVRYDFLVTTKRKKIWAIELDLLREFDRVCKEHGLIYWAIGGTLLGTIRHKGFIPWDDDIDVAMPRGDYEKLIQLGMEFERPYYLQTPLSERGYAFSFTKLRNRNSSGISMPFLYEKFNQGIWIDIFPIDNAKRDGFSQRVQRINELNLENSANMRRSNPHPTQADIERMKQYELRDYSEIYHEIDELAREYERENTECCALQVCTVYSPDRMLFPIETYESKLDSDFEIMTIPIPVGYRTQLEIMYDDYMKFPPMEQRGIWHSTNIFDPDVPFTELREKLIRELGE